MVILDNNMTEDEIVEALNGEIDKMREYGVTKIIVPKGIRARKITWSNSAHGWTSMSGPYKAGDKMVADANHLVVGNLPSRYISTKGGYWHLIPEIGQRLNVLPLYHGSFESKERGEFDLAGIDVPPGVVRNLDDPLNEEVLIAKLRQDHDLPDPFAEEWGKKFDD